MRSNLFWISFGNFTMSDIYHAYALCQVQRIQHSVNSVNQARSSYSRSLFCQLIDVFFGY